MQIFALEKIARQITTTIESKLRATNFQQNQFNPILANTEIREREREREREGKNQETEREREINERKFEFK